MGACGRSTPRQERILCTTWSDQSTNCRRRRRAQAGHDSRLQSLSDSGYQKRAMHGKRFMENGFHVVSGGTDNHLVLVDFRDKKINGARIDLVLDDVSIAGNKNTCPGDKSALNPSGMRFGAPALTSRNFKEADFEKVVDFIIEGVNLAIDIKNSCEGTMIKEFKTKMASDATYQARLADLRDRVENFAETFPMPGYDDW